MININLYCLFWLCEKKENLFDTNIDGVYQVLGLKPGNKFALNNWFPRLEVSGFFEWAFLRIS